jgi:hypothetical protein
VTFQVVKHKSIARILISPSAFGAHLIILGLSWRFPQ